MTKISGPLTSEEEAALVARARAQGISVDILLRTAVLQIISGAAEREPQPQTPLSAEEVNAALDEAADMIPGGTPPLSDEALSRESIYTREDEWNRSS